MKPCYLDLTGKRLLALALMVSLAEGCDRDKKDKPKDKCTAGVTNYSENGSKSCEETILSSISLSSDIKELTIGQNLSLTLEGVNQYNEKLKIDASKATWSSSDPSVTISELGVISGTVEVEDVTITAKVGELSAQYKLSIVGKSCDQTRNGDTRELDLYPKAMVAFNASCDVTKVQVKCENGTFIIPDDKSETCSKATVEALNAEPASFSLFKGESRQVNLFLIDSIGTRIPVPADQATWTIPGGAPVTQALGTITATENIEAKFEITVAARGFTTAVTVGPESKLDGFEQKDVLMKAGDEQTLTVKANPPVEAKELNWESSNPELVSVELGKIKALKADGTATITAKLDEQVISVNVNVEAALTITSEAVLYTDDQILNDGSVSVKLITAEKPGFVAFRSTVAGPAQEKEPILASPTEGCEFKLALTSQKNWDLAVKLDDTKEVLPANCEVELQLSTKAGQKINEKFKIPVDYSRISLTELPQVMGANGLELARVDYKLSSNFPAPKVTVSVLRKDVFGDIDCQFEVIQQSSSFLLVSKNPASQGCVGKFEMELKDTNYPDWTGAWSDLVVVSSERSLAEMCKAPNSDSQKASVTLIAQRNGFFPGQMGRSLETDCDNLSRDVREKSLKMIESLVRFEGLTPEEQRREGRPVYNLSLADSGITDLSPLARFVGLDSLDLGANQGLVDLTAIKGLKGLTQLILIRTGVNDFSPIFQFTKMTSLRLPQGVTIPCSPDITNSKIKEICK